MEECLSPIVGHESAHVTITLGRQGEGNGLCVVSMATDWFKLLGRCENMIGAYDVSHGGWALMSVGGLWTFFKKAGGARCWKSNFFRSPVSENAFGCSFLFFHGYVKVVLVWPICSVR